MKGTWKTDGDGSSGLALVAAVIAVAVIAVPVVDALAHLAEVLVITLGAVLGLAIIAAAAVAASRVHQGRPIIPVRVTSPRPVPWQRAETLQEPRRPAIGAPKQELHLHFHGVDADDVAAIIARQRGD